MGNKRETRGDRGRQGEGYPGRQQEDTKGNQGRPQGQKEESEGDREATGRQRGTKGHQRETKSTHKDRVWSGSLAGKFQGSLVSCGVCLGNFFSMVQGWGGALGDVGPRALLS